MRDKNKEKQRFRVRRHRRIRKKAFGTPDRPRLCVTRSLNHIQAQLIDDVSGHCMLCVSSLAPDIRGKGVRPKCEAGKAVGALLATRARELGMLKVVFDRGGYRYHGRVKALAEGARQGGLVF